VAKHQVDILENDSGAVEIQYEGRSLPYSVYDQQPIISQGEIVENKRLGAALALIRTIQDSRDAARLVSPKVSLRGKERIWTVGVAAGPPATPAQPGPRPGINISAPVAEFFSRFAEEQRQKRKRANDVINERKRRRRIEAALTQ
jgi:hypothetical protein